MGDSDDDFDRRGRRDKFRRERNEYTDRPAVARRDDYPERSEPGGNWGGPGGPRDRAPIPRRDYRDAGGPGGSGGGYNSLSGRRMDNYADRRDGSPPNNKRFRGGRDWEDRMPVFDGHYNRSSVGGGHFGGGGGGDHRSGGDFGGHDRDRDDEQFQPPMMLLKQFLHDQDDMIDEDMLIKKYNDYKINFKRAQIQEFFNRHKDEEWFRSKYFPDEIEKNKVRQAETNANRLKAFMDLFETDWLENVTLDVDKSDQLARLLDAAVICLEGGSLADLKALEENADEAEGDNKEVSSSLFAVEDKSSMNKAEMNNEDDTTGEKEPTAVASGVEGEGTTGEVAEVGSEDKESNEGELIEEGEETLQASEELAAQATAPPVKVEENKSKPQLLYKTCSIFFRSLIPTITRQELEDECRKFAGFKRLAFSEPQMDRRFVRRAWATYEPSVNIREICWALSSVKLKGTDIGAIVNRELARRIRSVMGLTSHKAIVRSDIRHAAKLIMKLDAEKNLWPDDEEGGETQKNGTISTIKAPSRNPLLKNITDYLIEEASAEEAALLGASLDDPMTAGELAGELKEGGEENGELGAANGTKDGMAILERDEELIKVLDRLLLYLRIVHSIDYYTLNEYPHEDEMPNRIGLVHARGLFSSPRVTPTEIADYLKDWEAKVAPLLEPSHVVTAEEARKFGLKDPEEAIEAFIKENTKELGEGKWLCPLSNKKFMGPEFVRKHIVNKHGERLEQVRAETHYFNNYIYDSKRPALPEHPSNRPAGQHQLQQPQQGQQHYQSRDYGRDSSDFGGGGRYSSGSYGRQSYGQHYSGGGGGRFHLSPYPPAHDNYARGGGFKRNRSDSSLRGAIDYDDVNVEELI